MNLIDAHVHVWDLKRLRYPWLQQVPRINRSYLLEDYDRALGGRSVAAMVFVQCECDPEQHLEELAWVQSLADADPRLQAIVPWAPLEAGDHCEAELARMAADSRVKGVRRIIQFEPDPDFCLKPNFIRGVQLLGRHGLHFEITISPLHFPRVMKVIAASPGTRFILDHIGNPDIAAGPAALEPWRTHLREFARSGPHFCKFSNLVCNASLDTWTLDDLRPFAEVVLETFGPERLIWGSDWPHMLRSSDYARWLDAAETLTSHLSAADRRRIFQDNALRFYRLDLSIPTPHET
ncbi:MAG: amidohydrolase family protein [Opitutaceae bacterium]|nr:amidohydrolase family protein [Opitutaceae bacterium]